MPITVTLAEREFRRTLSVTVQSDAFLQFGATFQTRLLQAELVSGNFYMYRTCDHHVTNSNERI